MGDSERMDKTGRRRFRIEAYVHEDVHNMILQIIAAEDKNRIDWVEEAILEKLARDRA